MGLVISFDAYERKARIAPAILVAFPLLTTLWTCFSWEGISLGGKVLGGVISVCLVYGASIVVRSLGRLIEPELWQGWGGPPSTILMRWRDRRISADLKRQYHEAIRNFVNLPTSSESEELSDTKRADELIFQAFTRVKGILRENDKEGLWFSNNADYGFQRNLLGSRKVWTVLAAIGFATNGAFSLFKPTGMVVGGLVINLIILVGSIYLGWFILPKGVEQTAFRYAESAWESFLNIATNKK
jgi:hypothetical protein